MLPGRGVKSGSTWRQYQMCANRNKAQQSILLAETYCFIIRCYNQKEVIYSIYINSVLIRIVENSTHVLLVRLGKIFSKECYVCLPIIMLQFRNSWKKQIRPTKLHNSRLCFSFFIIALMSFPSAMYRNFRSTRSTTTARGKSAKVCFSYYVNIGNMYPT